MSTADAVITIAESLKETDELPRKQIAEIVEVLGPDASLAILAETRRVQDDGGVAVRDGTRRRTDGGVFFSLAKAQLPKADRNRIFRVRPPKSADGEPAEQPSNGAAQPAPRAAPDRPRDAGRAGQVQTEVAAPGGRRRVVEVEVLRTFPKPASHAASAPAEVVAPRVPVTEAARPQQELRPLRRIITVAAPSKEEPPTTPDAARERIRVLLKALSPADQKRVVQELARELGVVEVRPAKTPRVEEPEPRPRGVDDATRERVLAAVTDALGLGTDDLARALYGEDTAGTKAKARGALDRWRRGDGK